MLGNIVYEVPHKFINAVYTLYNSKYKSNPSVNGRIFEYLVCETLVQESIVPFYYQASFERVPNADFDIVLYDHNRPVVLTLKTSLRERYKQADLEGFALRQVYRGAESYLITLSGQEVGSIQTKIKKGDIAGLQGCIVASLAAYDAFLNRLKTRKFVKAEKVMPLMGQIITD